MDILSGLDEQQRVVATTFDGPLCVLAGAGTGKTRSITHRIAYGVQTEQYQPEHILALTFTQKAAAEMAHRVRDLGVTGVAARTFHSAALRQLQHFWPTVTGGYLPDIMPSKAALVARALEGMKIQVDQAVLRDVAGDIEWRKVHGYTIADYLRHRPTRGGTLPGLLSVEVLADVHERYEKLKDENRRIDFDDVLLAAVGMMESEARVLDQIRAQYRYFLVDEYQDVSPIQARLLEVWLGQREDLVVVGDASQTIYSFAGAKSDYLLDFAETHPRATVVKLEKNYRSGAHIVSVANQVMAGKPGALTLEPVESEAVPVVRHRAATDTAEAAWIASSIAELHSQGLSLDDCAILMRFGAQSLAVENALREHGVSFRVQGATAFFQEPHVARAVMEIRGAAIAGIQGDLVSVVDDILFGIGLTDRVPEHQGAERAKYEDLVALRGLVTDAPPETTLMEFSDQLVRRSDTGESPSVGALTLSTVHSAKGQEWPVVFVLGLSEGQFPISYATTPEAIDEERRLFYVAVTRARRRLYLSYAEKSREGNSVKDASRFLRDISLEPERR
jgi:DNA helicase II / ATP-dependent DNA helicase PcrA